MLYLGVCTLEVGLDHNALVGVLKWIHILFYWLCQRDEKDFHWNWQLDGIGELLWQDQNQTNTRKVDIMIHLVQLCCWFQTTDVTPSIMRVITIIIAFNSFRLLNNEWPQLLGWGTCSAVAYIIDPGEKRRGWNNMHQEHWRVYSVYYVYSVF